MKNKVFVDHRGSHMKFFQDSLANDMGFHKVKEVFTTINKKGVVRAFHYQSQPKPQQKIIKPLSGLFNIRIIDMENKEVIEYNNWSNISDPIFVKEGDLLGYVALKDDSIMLYIADEDFYSEYNTGVNPMSFNVDWKYEGDLIMSDRDKEAFTKSFEDI